MKLIVQIPAYNESATIGEVVRAIPRHMPGITCVEVLVIDDGSSDDTATVALANGADHIVRHIGNKGLAAAFQTGIDTALRLGADVIVNTDADHQYPGDQIVKLVEPIVERRAEYVIGDRQVDQIEHFSFLKKQLQRLGSKVVRLASGTDVPDSVSGFRALTREAALRMFVTTDFSYTVENLIQAGKKRLTIATVAITTNPPTRPSKLANSTWAFIKRQASTIVRTYMIYEPLKSFSYLAAPFLLIGTALLLRALYVYVARNFGTEASNDQALVGGSVLFISGVLIFITGILADGLRSMRRLQEENLYRQRKAEIETEQWRAEIDQRMTQIEQTVEEREFERTRER
jgi:glycosyltransferase involved in cell wall biosynthesis